jgi:hypothetical protein
VKGAQPNASVIDERLQLSVFGFSQRPSNKMFRTFRTAVVELFVSSSSVNL